MLGYLSADIICSERANSFPRATLWENCSLLERDVRRQISVSISGQMEAIVFIILQIFLAQTVLKIGEYTNNSHLALKLLDCLKSPSSCLFRPAGPLATSSIAQPLRDLKTRRFDRGLTYSTLKFMRSTCSKSTLKYAPRAKLPEKKRWWVGLMMSDDVMGKPKKLSQTSYLYVEKKQNNLPPCTWQTRMASFRKDPLVQRNPKIDLK